MSEFGLVASGKRSIRDGGNYDHLFPGADGKDTIIKRDGNVKDTIDKMVLVVSRTLKDTGKISPMLKGRSLKETCEKIWTFLYNHIQYELDEKGLEQLRRPARSWQDRKTGIDCDCFSIFTSSILTNLGVNHELRITKYKDNWQHVYVIVPSEQSHRGYYIIDCVVDRFNYEKPYSGNKDFNVKKIAEMNGIPIAYLSGPDNNFDELMGIVLGTDFWEIDQMESLGQVPSESKVLDALYNHLVKTRNQLARNPMNFKTITDPNAYLKMIDYALEYWNTSKRDEALSILEQQENNMLREQAMQGFGEYGELGGFWDKVKKAVQTVKRNVVNVAKRAGSAVVTVAKKAGNAISTGVKTAIKAVIRFNPVTAVARKIVLDFMKANKNGVAGRLKWGYASQDQAMRKGVSASDWQKAKKAIAQMETAFGFNTKSSAANLKNSIIQGKAGGISGFGFPVAAAASAAGPVAELINKILSAIGLGPKTEDASATASLLPQTMPSSGDGSSSGEGSGGSGGSKIMDWVKANPGKATIGAVLVGTTLVFALSPKARKAAGFGSTSRRFKQKSCASLNGTKSKPNKKIHKSIRLQ